MIYHFNMRDITISELKEAPEIIQRMYWLSGCKVPISSSMYNEAKEKYPQYFEEERKPPSDDFIRALQKLPVRKV